MRGELPAGWDADIPVFPADAKGMATRVASGKVMNAIAPTLPALIGGSADLDPSTHTALKGLGDFEPPGASAATTRGLGGRRLELCRAQPPLRRARARDGRDRQRPGRARRHHPVRRDLPDLFRLHAPADPPRRADGPARRSTSSRTTASRWARTARRTSRSSSWPACARSRTSIVIRPADANETAVAWRVALETRDRPVALVLTRQDVPTLDRTRYAAADGLRRGAYVLARCARMASPT